MHCENALLLYLALKKAGAPPSELHLYSAGGHGFGLCQHGLDVCSWTKRAQQYLETIRVVPGDPKSVGSGWHLRIKRFQYRGMEIN